MPELDKDRQRFNELLTFYVNGTLPTEDLQWMDAYMVSHPDTQNELRFVEMLREASRRTASSVPESERLERLISEWKRSRPSCRSPSFFQRMATWLQTPMRIPLPAIAAVALLVIGQSVIIGSMMTEGSLEEAFRGERVDCIAGPRIRTVFNPDAKHMEVVLLLRKLEASVQDGPTETGEFWLTIPKGRSLEEAQAMLRSSALVDEAMVSKDSRSLAGCAK